MKKAYFLLFLALASSNAYSQKSHLTLKDLYTDLVQSLKTDDDADLLAFCTRVVMDDETLNFMREQDMCYKGVPCRLDQRGMTMDYVVDIYYQKLLSVKRGLEGENLLKDLKLVDNLEYKYDTEPIPAVRNIKTNKTRIVSFNEYNTLEKALKASDSLSTVDPKFKDQNLTDYLELIYVTIRGTEQEIQLESGNVKIFYRIGEIASVYGKKWSVVTIPGSSYSTDR